MEELLNFFSKDSESEPKDLLSFSYNPFDEHSSASSSHALDKILKYGQVIRIRPDTEYYVEFRGIYSLNGMVTFQDKQMSMLEFLKQTRDMYIESIEYYPDGIPQTRKNSNPLKYIEAYDDNKWTFLSKLINPKSYIEYCVSGYIMYMKDVKNVYYNKTEGGFTDSKYFKLSQKIKAFEAKWREKSLPKEWITAYEQRVNDIFTKEEPVPNLPIITVEFVQSIMNEIISITPTVTQKSTVTQPNAYMIFNKEVRDKVKEENPGLSITECSKIIGGMWSKLSDVEKKKFSDKSLALSVEEIANQVWIVNDVMSRL